MDASAPAVMRGQSATAQAPYCSLERVRRARQLLAEQDRAQAIAAAEMAARAEGYAAGVQTASTDTWIRGAKVGGVCGLVLGGFVAALLIRIFAALGAAS